MRGADKLVLALPKGRLMKEGLQALRRAGLDLEPPPRNRALRYDAGGAVVIEMRNADVPTYVELGVADAGIVGREVLLEAGSSLYDAVDLGLQPCHLSLIRPRGEGGPIRRVASKYPRLTGDYLRRAESGAEVVTLTGNVELACLTGLADAVVDIVQTGSTLAANGLEEVDVILHSTTYFVVNRAALKLKTTQLKPLIIALREGKEDGE